MSKRIELYTFFYKEAPVVINKSPYIPIMAGNAISHAAVHMKGDDTGKSISERNKSYSELTGTYWVWKNTMQDIVGVVHYRRFLTNKPEPTYYKFKRVLYRFVGIQYKRHGLIYTRNVREFIEDVLTEQEVIDLLHEYDVLMPMKRKLKYTVKKHYERYHNKTDLLLLDEILKEKYPDYVDAFHRVLSKKRLYANNMFIMKRADFDRCMEWLFDILFEFEKRIALSNYKGYQERVLGFIAERMLNVWLEQEQSKIKDLPVIYFKHFKSIK
ncbi:DUF4422 domain-containing protein [uncultured Sunxiuqinia sp.]|uniref:DUF4422 domain-containing protein n=1 Tax=uncultured Sunxiuqinia sp. TaxID=1573825 RepID=UPI002AA634EF|nr:DUF4422 domain-containing protein [uncultured Sunxiuqinia sp.]